MTWRWWERSCYKNPPIEELTSQPKYLSAQNHKAGGDNDHYDRMLKQSLVHAAHQKGRQHESQEHGHDDC